MLQKQTGIAHRMNIYRINSIRNTGLALLLMMITNYLHGQKNFTHQNLLWYGLFTTIKINENWYVQHELQQRHFIRPAAQHQFLFRSHLHRNLGRRGREASVGLCLFLQDPNNPSAAVRLTVPELRPHVETACRQEFGRLTLDHRFRLEARFFHNTNQARTALEDGFVFGNYRFRYKIQAGMLLLKLAGGKHIELKISNELHLNAKNRNTKRVFDQNRIYAGISCHFTQALTTDIGYLNLFQQRPGGDYFNRQILRFTLYHKLNLHPGKKARR